MKLAMRVARLTFVAAAAVTMSACAQAGALGEILGGVLGGGGGNQLQGTIQSVDSRNLRLNIRQSDGQTVAVSYDSQTQVVYQNQNYPVTSLEYGDQVTARIQQTQNGAYYTDLIQVNQSASASTGSGAGGSVQSVEGRVQQVDVPNGWFTMTTNNASLTVTMPYNPSRSDLSRFQGLRSGEYVRLYGVYLNNSRIELRQFY